MEVGLDSIAGGCRWFGIYTALVQGMRLGSTQTLNISGALGTISRHTRTQIITAAQADCTQVRTWRLLAAKH